MHRKKTPLILEMDVLLKKLFPICRSITGNGVRDTLTILQEYIPLTVHEVPTGTKAFDWSVPKEWNIHDAYVKDPSGKKIIDFKKCNLHVVGYSTPIRTKMTLSALQKHLHSLPKQPNLIPYKTSYYQENWGFCLSHKQLESLKDGEYEVVIDSSFKKGSLTYGELLIPGKSKEEILISCYVCHPSMGNDSISGVVLATFLARALLKKKDLRYSYRFIFVPETIGAIAWLHKNRVGARRIKHGLVATCVGDKGPFTYKKTRAGNAPIDRVVERVLRESGKPYKIVDFFPWGSDERQFNSPGFSLPIGSLMRSMYGTFPQYHTSGDDLRFVKAQHIRETLMLYLDVVSLLEKDTVYVSQNPYGEPQLGKRGLYGISTEERDFAMLWLMSYADGEYSLREIAAHSGIDIKTITSTARLLEKHHLLKRRSIRGR